MFRVVLAAVLAVALLAAAMPAVERARERVAAEGATASLERVRDAALALVATEEPTPGGAARRRLSLAPPDGGIGAAALDYLAVGGVPDCGTPRDTGDGDVLAYRLDGGQPHVAHLPVDLRVVTNGRVRGDEDPLVLRGDAHLTLALAGTAGEPTVLVGRGPASMDDVGPAQSGGQPGGGTGA